MGIKARGGQASLGDGLNNAEPRCERNKNRAIVLRPSGVRGRAHVHRQGLGASAQPQQRWAPWERTSGPMSTAMNSRPCNIERVPFSRQVLVPAPVLSSAARFPRALVPIGDNAGRTGVISCVHRMRRPPLDFYPRAHPSSAYPRLPFPSAARVNACLPSSCSRLLHFQRSPPS